MATDGVQLSELQRSKLSETVQRSQWGAGWENLWKESNQRATEAQVAAAKFWQENHGNGEFMVSGDIGQDSKWWPILMDKDGLREVVGNIPKGHVFKKHSTPLNLMDKRTVRGRSFVLTYKDSDAEATLLYRVPVWLDTSDRGGASVDFDVTLPIEKIQELLELTRENPLTIEFLFQTCLSEGIRIGKEKGNNISTAVERGLLKTHRRPTHKIAFINNAPNDFGIENGSEANFGVTLGEPDKRDIPNTE